MSEPDNRGKRPRRCASGSLPAHSAAILRTSASLNVGTVASSPPSTPRGSCRTFVTSGFTADEHLQLAAWPDGPRLFERSVHTSRGPNSPRLTTHKLPFCHPTGAARAASGSKPVNVIVQQLPVVRATLMQVPVQIDDGGCHGAHRLASTFRRCGLVSPTTLNPGSAA